LFRELPDFLSKALQDISYHSLSGALDLGWTCVLKKLTKKTVGALKPGNEPYEARDSELKGFLLRIEPGGTRSWFFEYRIKGRRNRLLLGRYKGLSPEGARGLATIAAGDVAKGIDLQERKKAQRIDSERARHSTLATFLERYSAWEATHRKVRHAVRIKSVFPSRWQTQPLSSLNAWTLESWRRDARKDGKKATTVNRDIAALKAVLSKAIEWGILDRSQIENLKPLKTDPIGRVRFLTSEEEPRLRAALRKRDNEMRKRRERYNRHLADRGEDQLPPYPTPFADHLEPLVLLLLNSGLRFGEATQLRHRDINLKDRLITVAGEGAKSGRTRVVPMNIEAVSVLSALDGKRDDYLFPGEADNHLTTVKTAWKALLKEARISGFRLHDLRHTFASRVKRGGADLYTVQRLLGHSSPMMTQRYAHLQPDDLRAAVEKVVSG
jgi:integrase